MQASGETSKKRGKTPVGEDEPHARLNGKKKIVGVAAAPRTGQVLGLEALVERDSDAFMDWLADCAGQFGVEAIAAYDLNTYKPAVERLGINIRFAWRICRSGRGGASAR